VYVPFARDGVTFATYRASGGPAVTSLTKADLVSIYTSATGANIGGVQIIACGIQTNSGTFEFWNGALGLTTTQENTGTTTCNNYGGTNTRLQENNGPALVTKGNAAPAGTQVIVGFSAGVYYSKATGLVPGGVGAITMGAITNDGNGNNIGAPVLSVAPYTINTSFYNNATFGRDLYNVLTATVVDNPGNDALKNLFVGPTAALCTWPGIASLNASYGFGLSANCGSTSLRGSYISGTS
jgi:hypothetical protein